MTNYNYRTTEKEVESYCNKNIKSTSRLPRQRRIIAFGDLHGDFDAMLVCLCHLAKVVKTHTFYRDNQWITGYKWVGGDTCVVILGDMIDRFRPNATILDKNNMTPGELPHDEEKIIDFLNYLSVQAHRDGGKVLKILGNHEMMNLRQEFKYATPHAQQARYGSSQVSRGDYFKPGGEGAIKIISCGAVPIAIIGDYIFVHGGILPGLVNELQQQGLKDIFQECTNIVEKAFKGIPLTQKEQETLSTLESQQYSNINNISDSTSFFWERRLGGNYYNMSRSQICTAIRVAFMMLGLSSDKTRIVIGHCPQSDRNMTNMHANSENMSWKFKNIESADKHRTVFSNPSELISASSGVPFGINYDCKNNNSLGQVWRTDVAMSRAFDFQQDIQIHNDHISHGHHRGYNHLEAVLLNRRPQVLEILWDSDKNEYQEKVIVSNNDLPRWWMDDVTNGSDIRVKIDYPSNLDNPW